MEKLALSILILTKDSAETLSDSLKSVDFANEIIILDDKSRDDTVSIASNWTTKIYSATSMNFADKRNEILKYASNNWVLYLDSDEILSDQLTNSIKTIVTNGNIGAYELVRQNIFMGIKMYPDIVRRLFHKQVLKGWQGSVHESPIIEGKYQQIKGQLVHNTHRDITSMLEKTNQWSELEADLRYQKKHPPVVWWRLIRIWFTFFIANYFGKSLYRFGRSGLFEAYFQAVDKVIVYVKLWSRQQSKLKG